MIFGWNRDNIRVLKNIFWKSFDESDDENRLGFFLFVK